MRRRSPARNYRVDVGDPDDPAQKHFCATHGEAVAVARGHSKVFGIARIVQWMPAYVVLDTYVNGIPVED